MNKRKVVNITKSSLEEEIRESNQIKKSKKEIESMIGPDMDLRDSEKRIQKKSKESDSSSEEDDLPEKKTRKRRKNNSKEKKIEKKPHGYINEKLMNEFIEPAQKNIKEIPRRSVDIGPRIKAKGTSRFNQDESLSDWIREFYANSNRTSEDIKKSVVDSLSKNIDNATTNNNEIKPEERKKKIAFDVEKDKNSFFEYDEDDELFGLANPNTYKMYQAILKDIEKREELFRKEGREILRKKLPSLRYPDPEKCSLAHCREFLREPRGKERYCRRMDECICKVLACLHPDSVEVNDPDEGFIAREFLLPSEKEAFEQRSILPEEPQLCLLCKRLHITLLHYYYSSNDIEPIEVIQDHQNEIDKKGEYAGHACICPVSGRKRTGIVAPIVKFNAGDYVYGRMHINGQSEPVKCFFEKNNKFFF